MWNWIQKNSDNFTLDDDGRGDVTDAPLVEVGLIGKGSEIQSLETISTLKDVLSEAKPASQ